MGRHAHGTYSAYAIDACRCPACSSYQKERVARNRAERMAAGRLSHGTRSAYDCGCRCDECVTARRAAYPAEKAARFARYVRGSGRP